MKPKIKFNKKLIWDYEITEKDLEKENVLILYLSRVLNNGTFNDVSSIPLELIEKYIDRLYVSERVRKFWKWYLGLRK